MRTKGKIGKMIDCENCIYEFSCNWDKENCILEGEMELDVKKIKVAMVDNAMNQTSLADKTGITRTTICTILAKGKCSLKECTIINF